ncbi:MAG: DUF3306 domain-containing protein [Litoricolaceae bacterium]|nr:DUF3306 domain-containing protein [Litorivicinaceae bacterium]
MSEDKGFLSRWSDRKLTAEQDESQSQDSNTGEVKESADEFEGKSDDEILMILELPDPETLKLGDTVEKFMGGRVPERIRARALRAFWKTNPVLANLAGLDEYWDDYTDAAMIIENMETIYQVGKGYAAQALDALESLADDDSQGLEVNPVESVDQTISDRNRLEEPVDDELLITFDEPDAESIDSQASIAEHQEAAATLSPKPRRMSFQ